MLRHLTQNDSLRSDDCSRYAAGHRVHWIHAKRPVTAGGELCEGPRP